MLSEARIATANGARYAQQLCKHATHMGPRVEWKPPVGTIDFPDNMGTCRLSVEPDCLRLVVESADPITLGKLQHILAANIERFGFREKIKVVWGADAFEDPQRFIVPSVERTRLWNVVVWLPPAIAGLHVAAAAVAYIAALAGFTRATQFVGVNPWIVRIGAAWGLGVIAWWAVAKHRDGNRMQRRGH